METVFKRLGHENLQVSALLMPSTISFTLEFCNLFCVNYNLSIYLSLVCHYFWVIFFPTFNYAVLHCPLATQKLCKTYPLIPFMLVTSITKPTIDCYFAIGLLIFLINGQTTSRYLLGSRGCTRKHLESHFTNNANLCELATAISTG